MRQKPVRFGKYLLLQRLSIGGMAEVIFAKTSGFDRVLAIKRVLPGLAEDDEFVQMFVDEARLSLLLNHPNIVQVFDFGQYEGTYYLATEYVAGKDLRAILQQCLKREIRVPLPLAVHIASRVCAGLGYAHTRKDSDGTPLNIVHRDVSPPNIVCSWAGEIKLIDFGIAKSAARTQQTRVGMLKGKAAYMSPEQAQGLAVDQRSDVFAIGAVLYEMLTGKPLYEGTTEPALLKNACLGQFIRPSKHNPEISKPLEQVLLKALARLPGERLSSATALRDELLRVVPQAREEEARPHLVAFVQETCASEYARDQQRLKQFAQIDAAWQPEGEAAGEDVSAKARPAGTVGLEAPSPRELLPVGASGLPGMTRGFTAPSSPRAALTTDSATVRNSKSAQPSPAYRVSAPPALKTKTKELTPPASSRATAAVANSLPDKRQATVAARPGPRAQADPEPIDDEPTTVSMTIENPLAITLDDPADAEAERTTPGFVPLARPALRPSEQPPIEDRRVYARLPAAIAVLRRSGSKFVEERTRDISFGGIALGTRALLMPGTEAEFTLTSPDGSFEVPFVGQVANARSVDDEFPFLAGIRIVRMDPGLVPLYESLMLRQLDATSGLRAHLRLQIRFACVAFWKEAGARPAATTRIVDIGVGGVRCASASAPKKGARGLLTLASPVDDRLLSVPAQVVWTAHGGVEDQAGIRFASDPVTREQIIQLIREVIFVPQRPLTSRTGGDLAVRVGDFDCRALIALGQHFEVFSGSDRKVQWAGKRVALKRLRPGAGPRALEAFLEEADVLRMLDHPVAIRAHAALQFGGENWLITQLADGRSLAQAIASHGRQRRHLPVQAVLSVTSELVRVMIHRRAFTRAHDYGNGPLCIKPSGVMIDRDGDIKVVDFGTLDVIQTQEPGTSGLAAILPYMPPEQWPDTDAESGAGDVYTISVLIYEALTGVCPFRGATLDEIRAAFRRGPVGLRRLNPEVPAALESLVLAGLSLDPRKRPPRLSSFLADLDRAAPFPRAEEGRRMRAALLNARAIAS